MIDSDIVILATPVYWYAMSAQMKTFFDRFSDCVRVRKSLGRKLKGKQIYLVTTGTDKELPEGFEVPFKSTCKYLDMIYKKGLYIYIEQDGIISKQEQAKAKHFSKQIL